MNRIKIRFLENKKAITKVTAYLSLLLFLIALGYFLVALKNYAVLKNKAKADNENEKIYDCVNCEARILDGILVEKSDAKLPLFAFTIDNHIDSRPAKGIEQAQLIYEAEAEGGITRFLAVFDAKNLPEKIGPIRSARPYFVDWANELDAAIVHCGGSPEALARIKQYELNDLNEFYKAKYFWRDEKISAPHNIFSSKSLLLNFLNINNLNSSNLSSWKYKDNEQKKESNKKITIDFGSPEYLAIWHYNSMNNSFKRQIVQQKYEVKNLIIQYVKSQVLDEKLRLKIDTIGEGDTTVCLNGECREGKWKKANISARTKFYDLNNKEIEFNPGQTWIEVVNSKNQVGIE